VKLGAVLERIAIVVASLALAFGLIALLSGFFAGRDQAGVSAVATGPGRALPDLGHAHLRPGAPHPRYASDPPTSGAHVPVAVRHDERRLSTDQLLQALELGDVVVMYGGRKPPPGLPTLASSLAPPFTPALVAAGQAVILARRPGTRGLLGLAWAHAISVAHPGDPRLRTFVQFWLGRGAPGRTTPA
jgi:Protein of unknown function (DUF3105)